MNVGARVGLKDGADDGKEVVIIVGLNVEIGARVGEKIGALVAASGGNKTKLGDGYTVPPLLNTTHIFTVPVDGITIFVVNVLPLLVG